MTNISLITTLISSSALLRVPFYILKCYSVQNTILRCGIYRSKVCSSQHRSSLLDTAIYDFQYLTILDSRQIFLLLSYFALEPFLITHHDFTTNSPLHWEPIKSLCVLYIYENGIFAPRLVSFDQRKYLPPA